MFEDVIQLILRNTGSQGYETLYSSSDVEVDNELLPYLLPRSRTSTNYPSYYFKYPINHDFTLVKLVQDDGLDAYNRFKAKVVLFIVPREIYEEKNGLLFFASPLWLNTISLEKNEPLDYTKDFDFEQKIKNEFEKRINPSFLAFLLDKMLFYNNLVLMIDDKNNLENDRIFLMQALAYLDNKLPLFMRNQITIKTLTNKNYSIANCILLDHAEKNFALGDDYYLLTFDNTLLRKDFTFETSKLAKTILASEKKEGKELISKALFNSKAILKDELVTNDEYTKLLNRFKVKDTNIWKRFFKNFGLR